jgi:hypothetical protein
MIEKVGDDEQARERGQGQEPPVGDERGHGPAAGRHDDGRHHDAPQTHPVEQPPAPGATDGDGQRRRGRDQAGGGIRTVQRGHDVQGEHDAAGENGQADQEPQHDRAPKGGAGQNATVAGACGEHITTLAGGTDIGQTLFADDHQAGRKGSPAELWLV